MPSLKSSLISLDPKRYERLDPRPVKGPIEAPFTPMPAPEFPTGLKRSTVMLSSLPIISTNVDGVIRQFYGGPNFPSRRLNS